MNWPKRAFTNTQQAPGAVQSARRRAGEIRVEQHPLDHGHEGAPEQERDGERDDGVERRREQLFADDARVAHRVTSAIRALYQFINADTARPIER